MASRLGIEVKAVEAGKEEEIKDRGYAKQLAWGNYGGGRRWFAVFAVLLYLGWSRNEFKL